MNTAEDDMEEEKEHEGKGQDKRSLMACRAVEIWTLTSLIGAYVDLILASLFLVGATIAFFASKLLSLFRLSLPCSCDGHFGHPACAQTRFLLDFPASRVAGVRRSLLSRFPYDSLVLDGDHSSHRCRYAVRLASDDRGSCTTASLSNQSRSISLPTPSTSHPRRRRTRLGDSMSSLEKFPSALAERVSAGLWNFNADGSDAGLVEVAVNGEKDSRSNVGGAGECDGGIFDMTRSLERELGDEQGALATLYLELEKERSAAATAADEAMSMMLKLQKEKAEIEMEARQYQRMTEEKSAYEKEEMEILKEIIVRREREKHVLEKEIEMYKQKLDSREQFEHEFDIERSIFEEKKGTLNDTSDNPMIMLRQIYKHIETNEVSDGFGLKSFSAVNSSGVCSYHGNSITNFVDVGKHTELFNNGDDIKQDIGENHMLTTQIKQSSNILNFSHAEESILCNLNAPFEGEYDKDILDLNVRDEGDGIPIEMSVPDDDLYRIEGHALDQRGSESFQPETESRILDVLIINNGQFFQVEQNNKQNDDHFFHVEDNGKQNAIPLEASSCTNFNEREPHIQRSCSEITNRIGQKCSLSTRGSFLDLKRNSLPSIESEKFKLGNEVECLRERLEIIRQGREKLNLSTDHKEKEYFQLQLLDEIAYQLKQIKKVSEPTKSFRQASLPPLSPKVKWV